MTYQFQPGDYIRFKRIVRGKTSVRFSTDYDTGRPIAHPEIPEQVLPQEGEGLVVGEPKIKKVKGEKYTVIKVQAPKPLGKVNAVVEDAILVAKQDSLFDMAPVEKSGPNVYGADAKGIA